MPWYSIIASVGMGEFASLLAWPACRHFPSFESGGASLCLRRPRWAVLLRNMTTTNALNQSPNLARSIVKKKSAAPSLQFSRSIEEPIFIRDSTGFSRDVCAVLLVANITRCFFWLGRHFELGGRFSMYSFNQLTSHTICSITRSVGPYEPCPTRVALHLYTISLCYQS